MVAIVSAFVSIVSYENLEAAVPARPGVERPGPDAPIDCCTADPQLAHG
jgi:hypothetical protein